MNTLVDFWNGLGAYAGVMLFFALLFVVHLVNAIRNIISACSRIKCVAPEAPEGVSLILTANNKADYIQENLVYYLNQDYPSFEVIFVDECSEDDSIEVLEGIRKHYPALHITRIFPGAKFRNTKKLAINIGVMAAHHDIILFSDITCRPDSVNWISAMASCFRPDTAVVLGYANYTPAAGQLDFRRYFRFLRFMEQIFLVRRGAYVQGEGCNMGFRKKHYLTAKVFSKNSHRYAGYDSEIVRLLSQKGKVGIARVPEAVVRFTTGSPSAWKEDVSHYFYNRKKWPFVVRMKSGNDFFIRFLFCLTAAYLIVMKVYPLYVAAAVLFLFVTDIIVINIFIKRIKETKLFLTSLTSGTVGFLYRWYYKIYSLFTAKKWR